MPFNGLRWIAKLAPKLDKKRSQTKGKASRKKALEKRLDRYQDFTSE